MLTGRKAVAIVDIDTVADKETGDRSKAVERGIYGVYAVELVGVNTAQLGQSLGFTLSYSIVVPRIVYSGERYVFFDGNLYTVQTLGKAKSETEMTLNVQELKDDKAVEAVRRWIDERSDAGSV